MRRRFLLLALHLIIYIGAAAQNDSIAREASVQEVTVTSANSMRRMGGAVNGVSIGRQELFKAACCNLGESFTTNPSVDVTYSDAATGAKQIRLLGLSGTYVQMLTEQLPAFQGAALPYALDYVPGPWMQSIQVSKGASTVKNGYESITGQIDIEYLKPNDTEHLDANLYADSKSRLEANFNGNLHLTPQLTTVLLGHAEKSFAYHDDNGDSFLDMPRRQQYHLANRWKLVTDRYIMHAGISALQEKREGGQNSHLHSHSIVPPAFSASSPGTATPPAAAFMAAAPGPTAPPAAAFMAAASSYFAAMSSQPPTLYAITTEASRYEAYMKHAFILNPEHQTNIAFMANGTLHLQDATYGLRTYDNNEKTLNAQLLYETNLTDRHQLSLGASLNHYYSKYGINTPASQTFIDGKMTAGHGDMRDYRITDHETTTGLYTQYTLTLDRFTAMAGLRADYSDAWHWFVTPRLHLKYTPGDLLTIRASAGRGYRTPRFFAECHYLMASGRPLVTLEELGQEKAWNMGTSTAWNIPVGEKTLKLNAEYYYTTFQNQTVVNYTNERLIPIDMASAPNLWPVIYVSNLHGRSYSHTFQVDATYPLTEGLTVTAAWRWNDVKCSYQKYGYTGGDELLERPLTSRYKGLVSLSYVPGLGLWHFDTTLQLNGGGRIVDDERFHSYEQLQAQVTRDFRHFSVYVGGENLTNFKQRNPIREADNPWGPGFDATLVWGPVHGPVFYIGMRYNIEKL